MQGVCSVASRCILHPSWRPCRGSIQPPLRQMHPRITPLKSQFAEEVEVENGGALEELKRGMEEWSWQGHSINYLIVGKGPPLMLVHGFGGSILHFRKNIPVLAKTHTVYALDLIGYGSSAKPPLAYCMELWRDLIIDFSAEFISEESSFALVGNSVGSLACLMTAATLQERINGIALLNCAGAMNNKSLTEDWRIRLALPLFLLIDFLLRIKPVADYLFNTYASKDNVQRILQGVYCNQTAVDEELVDIIHRPSTDPGAQEVFISIITGPGGPRPQDLALEVKCPILVLWGDTDPFTPFDGPVAEFFRNLQSANFVPLTNVGHCPHDDRPELVHKHLLPWLQKLN